MHRLLQGEVGSGKTVVALRAMLRVVDSGGQAALLAPTEVLAQQHHRSITGDARRPGRGRDARRCRRGRPGWRCSPARCGAAARQARRCSRPPRGEAGIVIGTHALLEERVQFADLGLVVVDEQHRFGVEQRAALADKAGRRPPHVLVMTATPIPRTVAMTVFGDLETSTLGELPAGRAPDPDQRGAAAEQPRLARPGLAAGPRGGRRRAARSTSCARGSATAGRRAADEPSPTGRPPAESAGSRPWRRSPPSSPTGPLAGLRVAMLHGRLPPEEKDRTMRAFAAGEIDVLVATTVIEVGVDVANATAMVILDADRFGVSQLHQLRGRVGRGGHPGLCLLVTQRPSRARRPASGSTRSPPPPTASSSPRLDLEQRREGDVLGASQSGRRSGLRLLSVLRDEDVIADARARGRACVADDPGLEPAPGPRAAVGRRRAVRLLEESWSRRARATGGLGVTRIIGGTAGGRRHQDAARATPPGRPRDRVREALFSALEAAVRLAGRAALPRPVRRVGRGRPGGVVARCRRGHLRRAGPAHRRADPATTPRTLGFRGADVVARPVRACAASTRRARRTTWSSSTRPTRSTDEDVGADLGALVRHGWLAPEATGGRRALQPRRAAGLAGRAASRDRGARSTARPCFGTVTQRPTGD